MGEQIGKDGIAEGGVRVPVGRSEDFGVAILIDPDDGLSVPTSLADRGRQGGCGGP